MAVREEKMNSSFRRVQDRPPYHSIARRTLFYNENAPRFAEAAVTIIPSRYGRKDELDFSASHFFVLPSLAANDRE